jgi:hypothetical protein
MGQRTGAIGSFVVGGSDSYSEETELLVEELEEAIDGCCRFTSVFCAGSPVQRD